MVTHHIANAKTLGNLSHSPGSLIAVIRRSLAGESFVPARQPDHGLKPEPVSWIKAHNLPDYAYFDHRAHVGAGVKCQTCHGPAEAMERARQAEDLSMSFPGDGRRPPTRPSLTTAL